MLHCPVNSDDPLLARTFLIPTGFVWGFCLHTYSPLDYLIADSLSGGKVLHLEWFPRVSTWAPGRDRSFDSYIHYRCPVLGLGSGNFDSGYRLSSPWEIVRVLISSSIPQASGNLGGSGMRAFICPACADWCTVHSHSQLLAPTLSLPKAQEAVSEHSPFVVQSFSLDESLCSLP